MEKQVNINAHFEGSVGQLTFRTVKGLDEVAPLKQHFTGVLSAPFEYAKTKLLENELPVVVSNIDKRKITLFVNPSDQYAPTVEGVVSEATETQQFKINQAHTFSREELIKLFKFNRRFFAIREEYDKAMLTLSKFKVTTQTEIEQGSDNRGNRSNALQKRVNFERDEDGNEKLPQNIKLALPLYQGTTDKAIIVEICVDTTEHTTRFWLESTELLEMQKTALIEMFSKEIENFKNLDFTVIEQ